MNTESPALVEKWNDLKTLLDAVELDLMKDARGVAAAGVRARKGLREVVRFTRELVKMTKEFDKQLKESRKKERAANGVEKKKTKAPPKNVPKTKK